MQAKSQEDSEDYRWNSLGYHLQIHSKDHFLSTDFGFKVFNPPSADKCLKSPKERIRRYRRYVYEAGAINHLTRCKQWYHCDRGGGHPWEVYRGGNTTHIDLGVAEKAGDGSVFYGDRVLPGWRKQ